MTAASVIFFAYIGFDAVSTSGEEVEEPGRNLPIAIIASLAIATTLYILVSIVATAAVPFDKLKGAEAPLATVLSEGAASTGRADIISFGALVAITSVVLTLLYGQSRILFAMSRDGLLPRGVREDHREAPHAGAHHRRRSASCSRSSPRSCRWRRSSKLVNIGTLFAFVVVNIGVIILRRTRPDLERGYRVPFVPLVPARSAPRCAST